MLDDDGLEVLLHAVSRGDGLESISTRLVRAARPRAADPQLLRREGLRHGVENIRRTRILRHELGHLFLPHQLDDQSDRLLLVRLGFE